MVFIGKRRGTVERVKHSRGASQDVNDISINKVREDDQSITIKTRSSKGKAAASGAMEKTNK